MQLYLVTYQSKRPESNSVLMGDWKDHEQIVVGTDNATSAINAVIKFVNNNHPEYYFRLKEVKRIHRVDMIAPSLLK